MNVNKICLFLSFRNGVNELCAILLEDKTKPKRKMDGTRLPKSIAHLHIRTSKVNMNAKLLDAINRSRTNELGPTGQTQIHLWWKTERRVCAIVLRRAANAPDPPSILIVNKFGYISGRVCWRCSRRSLGIDNDFIDALLC